MAKYLENVLTEPRELQRSLAFSTGPGRAAITAAAGLLRRAKHIYVTGIGSSWHAGMAVQAVFAKHGCAVHLVDASELLHFVPLEKDSVLIALSRSGASVEIVRLMEKASAADTKVVAVTNTQDSPLAKGAAAVLQLEAAFDHLVSVTMYSALTLVGGLLAEEASAGIPADLIHTLGKALQSAQDMLPTWRQQLAKTTWFDGTGATYFLARGGSLATCHETRLLWEEAAKTGASAMTTGGFRHGPQEMILGGARIGMWLDPAKMRREDLALAEDLRRRGVKVLLVGSHLEENAVELVLNVPPLPEACGHWQFLLDIIPGQLAAYELSTRRGVNCDAFQICPYVITSEGGLTGGEAGKQ